MLKPEVEGHVGSLKPTATAYSESHTDFRKYKRNLNLHLKNKHHTTIMIVHTLTENAEVSLRPQPQPFHKPAHLRACGGKHPVTGYTLETRLQCTRGSSRGRRCLYRPINCSTTARRYSTSRG